MCVIISSKIKGTEHYVVGEEAKEESVGAPEETSTCAIRLSLLPFSHSLDAHFRF